MGDSPLRWTIRPLEAAAWELWAGVELLQAGEGPLQEAVEAHFQELAAEGESPPASCTAVSWHACLRPQSASPIGQLRTISIEGERTPHRVTSLCECPWVPLLGEAFPLMSVAA